MVTTLAFAMENIIGKQNIISQYVTFSDNFGINVGFTGTEYQLELIQVNQEKLLTYAFVGS